VSAPLLLALDQGTTSTRAILFGADGEPRALARRALPQSYPSEGRVEHDPLRIRNDAIAVIRTALERAGVDARAVAALGITNQRETVVLWERETGRPVHPALVWQDRRTAARCRALREEGIEPGIRERTGLLLDPYFSATKLEWLLENVSGARESARRGELAFGTVDSWLVWCLTGGRVHATDATNASRTLLADLRSGEWDGELLDLFGVPPAVLPRIGDSAGDFGETDAELFGAPIPIRGVAGDQQAATFGQAAFEPGMMKATYGTGGFLLMNTGREPFPSEDLLATVAWRLQGEATYALEGSIFSAGSAVSWLVDELGILEDPAESARLASRIEDTGGVHLVPGFTGLGAPHWDPDARGALLGLTRDTGPAHLARAALEAVGYQTRDLVEAMAAAGADRPSALRVDGGLSRNDWAMGFLADLLDTPVERPATTETTALGAAGLAGLGAGVHGGLEELGRRWSAEKRWEPRIPDVRRRDLYEGWKSALRRVLTSRSD